jgi:hypothetical protein
LIIDRRPAVKWAFFILARNHSNDLASLINKPKPQAMKKTLLFAFLFFTGMLSAQIVNIPDAAFKNLLINAGTGDLSDVAKDSTGNYVEIDTNNDGEIQLIEAQAIWALNLYGQQTITSLAGLEAFTNLRFFVMHYAEVVSLDLSSQPFLEEVTCTNGQLTNLNINNRQHLKKLNCYGNNLTTLNFSGLESLEELYGSDNPVTSVDITAYPSLKKFIIANTPTLTSITVAGLTLLEEVDVSNTSITSLNLNNINTMRLLVANTCPNLIQLQTAGLTNLEVLDCMYSSIDNFNLQGMTSLKTLKIRNCPITQINLSDLISLEYINAYDTKLTSLNLNGLINLKDIYFSSPDISALHLSGLPELQSASLGSATVGNTSLTEVVVNNVPKLEFLALAKSPLETLTIGYLPLLNTFGIGQTNLISLDLSQCPKLEVIHAVNVPSLEYINIKNGSHSMTQFLVTLNTNPLKICVDENEIAGLHSILAITENGNNADAFINSYCSFTPGGNYNIIAGTFTYDADSNGCTTSDISGKNIKIGLNDGTQTGSSVTNVSGNYNFYTQSGNFSLTPQFENNWFTATPATATVNFVDNNSNISTQNFCITPNGVHPDVEVVLLPVNGAQPGFDARYQIVFKNKGNQTLNGNIVLNYDEAVLDYVALGSTMPTSTASGQLTWNYSNLLPFESCTINVALNLNAPMETPAVNLDDVLNYNISITPSAGDETPLDNTFTLNQVVTGSYDPNDITCLEGETVHPDKIGDYLHYNINFENTGTAPATFIVVKDMINAQQYDINTLQMLNASHNVETRINGNKVEFFFDNISLAPLAKGNVVFKMKTKPTLAVNSTVMNKAEIFFDYNWPIATNEAETTFALLSAGDFDIDNSVSVYPNPAITNVTIKASSEITSVQLYDMQGRLLLATKDTSIDISNRASGMYFLKVMTEKGIKVEKLVRK